jgi:class 3 adenylate cyclase
MPRSGERRFATILFTDVVGSTDIAEELGDRRWREVVRRHHVVVRRELRAFEGREVDTAGDGFFATFDSPGAAIRCACAISLGVRELGLEVRAGLHAGEVEVVDGKEGGIAVNTAARVMALGGAGDVLVSASLHDIVAGSSLAFADRGVHQLKGIAGGWRIFAVNEIDGEPRTAPLDPREAADRRMEIGPPPAGPTKRAPLFVAGAIALIAAVGGLAVLTTSGSEPESTTPAAPTAASGPGPGSIAKLDLRTGELLVAATAPHNATPAFENEDLEIGEGSVWLVRGANLLKVDPEDASAGPAATGTSTVGNQGLDTGFGTVWLLHDDLFPVDPGTGAAGEPVGLLQTDPDLRVNDVATGLDRVWVATIDGELFRVDPRTLRTSRFRIGGTTEHLAVGSDAVWMTDEFDGVVLRFDPVTEEVVDRIELAGGLDAIVVGEGFVWVLDSTLGTLTPIEEDDGETRTPIDVGDDAEDVAIGAGSVWLAVGGSVLELNPSTLQIERTIEVGANQILELEVDPSSGALWISIEGSQ